MVGGSVICGLSMLVFAIVGVAAPKSSAAAKCLAGFVCIYIFAYGASLGPVMSVIIGETPSTRLRSRTIAIATSASWTSDVLIVCGMPYLISADYANLGTKVGFIFGALEVLIIIYMILFLPEMKDRTLEEIDEMFMNVSLAKQQHLHSYANERRTSPPVTSSLTWLLAMSKEYPCESLARSLLLFMLKHKDQAVV